MTTRVKTLEEGQYKLFNILKEIQEWWEAQAIVAVIGQNASVDSEEEDIVPLAAFGDGAPSHESVDEVVVAFQNCFGSDDGDEGDDNIEFMQIVRAVMQ